MSETDNPLVPSDEDDSFAIKMPPEMYNVFEFGFDARTWEFCTGKKSLFTIVLDAKHTVQWPRLSMQQDFAYPVGIRIATGTRSDRNEVKTFRGQHTTHEDDFAATFSTALSIAGISAEVETALATKNGVTSDATSRTCIASAYKVIYKGGRVDKDPEDASSAFKDALSALSADDAAAETFLDEWGTHFLAEASFGGTWQMKVTISDSETTTTSDSELETKVTTGFNDGAEADLKAQADIKSRVADSLSIKSGHDAVSFVALGGIKTDTYDDWDASVEDLPALLIDLCTLKPAVSPTFEPILTLVPDGHPCKEALIRAWNKILPIAAMTVAAPIAFNIDQEHVIETDGLLHVEASVEAVVDHATFLKSDLSATSLSGSFDVRSGADVIACGAVQMCSEVTTDVIPVDLGGAYSNTWRMVTPVSATFCPVKAGDVVTVKTAAQPQGAAYRAWFRPLPLGLSKWRVIADWQSQQVAEEDGFVLVSAIGGNGCRITGAQSVEGQLTRVVAASSASVGDIDIGCAGFCMPVPGGISFQIGNTNLPQQFLAPDAPPATPAVITARWISACGREKMGQLTRVESGVSRQAVTNGFLVGYLSCPDNPAAPTASSMQLQTSADGTFPPGTGGEVYTMGSVSSLPGAVISPPFAALSFPPAALPFAPMAAFVAKGFWYRIVVTDPVPQPGFESTGFWLPLS